MKMVYQTKSGRTFDTEEECLKYEEHEVKRESIRRMISGFAIENLDTMIKDFNETCVLRIFEDYIKDELIDWLVGYTVDNKTENE